MKHTIIILAHKNLTQVLELAKFFSRNCYVIIHIDKKQKVNQEILNELANLQQVISVSQQYEVNWGGYSILECEIGLLNDAIEKTDSEYFHLISGQDYPVRSLEFFLDFFERRKGKNFIQYTHLPHPGWEGNTYKRFQYYYPYDYSSNRPNPRKWVWEEVKKQQEKGIKRPIPDEFDHLYGGSQWFSITREAVRILLDYTSQKPSLYRRMWMTFAPEESYIATVLVNLLEKDKIENSNHRYIRWKHENGNRPANLGLEHFYYLLDYDYLFARKIEHPISNPLLKQINRYLISDNNIIQMSNGGWEYDGYLKYHYDAKFFSFVAQFYQEINATKAVDIGCGSGFYVAKWRRSGLFFDGYDINPYTPSLSNILQQDGDVPCGVADITKKLELNDSWDLVVCKDVLQYIPTELTTTAINNLCQLSSHYVIFSYNSQNNIDSFCQPLDWSLIEKQMQYNNFEKDEYMTARIQVVSNKNVTSAIFRMRGKDIMIGTIKQ